MNIQRHLHVSLWNACPGKQGVSMQVVVFVVVLVVKFVDGGAVVI